MNPLVIGIDPGSSHWSFYGFTSDETILDISVSTNHWQDIEYTLRDVVELTPDLVVGPSGYGLPLIRISDLSVLDRELAILYQGSSLIGVRKALEVLRPIADDVMLIPGVKHLSTVPNYRKINRVDMGTADKVCAVAYSITFIHERMKLPLSSISFIHVELGYGFNAYIGIEHGKIVDGIGGSLSTLSFSSGGALDAELAFLLHIIPKKTVFQGGILSIPDIKNIKSPYELCDSSSWLWNAYVEAIAKDIARTRISTPLASLVVLSGQYSDNSALLEDLIQQFPSIDFQTITKKGLASVAARGAAIIANGLCGGKYEPLVKHMGIQDARGTVLDHIYYQAYDSECLLSQIRRKIEEKY
ncbi:MAG: DUF1464 family protein [Promethearchaeota archaeon]